MAVDIDSDSSSALSSPPGSPLLDAASIVDSSSLSSLVGTPEPPDDFIIMPKTRKRSPEVQVEYLPSPPASQESSQNGSPTPDGMDSETATDKEGPPPAKRRRVSKQRTTEYLNLRKGKAKPSQRDQMDRLLNVLYKRQKIVVVAGAGISVSAGIPDFRSGAGLFNTLKAEHNLKGSGKDLFDASVYKDDSSTSTFHSMVSSMSRLTKQAKPTAFHHMLATIAREDRLLRLYSQNVDGIDTSLGPLKTRVPLRKDESGKWPKTVQLHGGLEKMVCSKCHELSDFDADLFDGPTPPACASCETVNDIRTNMQGKRSHGIGRLRPRMVLYNEHNPDDEAIGAVTREDMRRRPDAVIVVGTTLKVPGVKRIVREMCGIVRDRKDGGMAIWINNDRPPSGPQLEDCFDIIVQGSCEDVAIRAAMPRWDDPAQADDFDEVSEEAAKSADAKKAKVLLPRKKELAHLAKAELPSAAHKNNSFQAPSPHQTPKRAASEGPRDWSPMSSQRSSIIPSIEIPDSDDLDVSVATGLLTPTKSHKGSPSKQLPSLNDRLKDTAKPKKPTPKNGKPSVAATKKKTGVNVAKPTAKPKSAPKPQTMQKSKPLTNVFKLSKSGAAANLDSEQKSAPSLTTSPSKLRQVSNSSSDSEPMLPVSLQHAKSNTFPSKKIVSPTKRAVFPGLMSENASSEAKKARMGSSIVHRKLGVHIS